MAFRICRAELVVSQDQRIQGIFLPDLGLQTMSSPGFCPSWCPSRPKQRTQTTMELILWPHLGRKPSQKSYTTVLSYFPFPSSDLKHFPQPKIGHNSRPHLPNNITRQWPRNLSWADRWRSVSAKNVKSGRGTQLLKCRDPNVRMKDH